MELRRIAPVIRFVTIVTALKLTVVSCVPMKYEIGYRNSIDLDAEQTEARYDQGMLSDIMNDDRAASELQKAESCVADNFKYDHGQKIQRYDPCEICLCIDGEIFCWWKQCDIPAKSDLSGNPPIDTTSSYAAPRLQPMTKPSSSSPSVAATTSSPTPSQPALPDQGYPGSSSTVTTTTSSASQSTATTNNGAAAVPQEPAVLSTSTTPDDAGGTAVVRILHPPPPEAIPQNILAFPQTPPIMMYRPVALPVVKNATSSSAAIPLLSASEQTRNKHRPAKKVSSLFHGKKPFRKSQKSKEVPPAPSYVINYGPGSMVPSMTERITSGPPVSFDEAAGRLTVGDRNDGRKQGAEGDDDDDEDEEDDDDEEEDDEGSAEAELRGQIYDGARSDGAGKMVGNRAGSKGDTGTGQFGGYGYGMFKEPDEDKQQHYIITSSGHVEMFDDDTDGSMEATENAFGMNRFPTGGSGTSTTGQPSSAEGVDHPVPPLITMTTNVTTQNWNYSGQQQQLADSGGTSGQGPPPLTPFVPLAGGSVIDVLNSTTLDGGSAGSAGDYLDDNQTELIYPAVPGLTGEGDGSGSNSRRSDSDRQTAGPETATTTTVMVGVAGTSDMASALTTSSSSSSSGGRMAEKQEKHCVVMGVSYKVGSVLKQETGNCLHCVCVAGPEDDPVPRVTCTPLNCPPLILPDILDGAGF